MVSTRVALLWIGGLLLVAGAAIVAAGSASAACADSYSYNVAPTDHDGDGLMDSVHVYQNYVGGGVFDHLWIVNVTLSDTFWGFTADFQSQHVYVNSFSGGYVDVTVIVPPDWYNQDFDVDVATDEYSGACQYDYYTYNLYPLGVYASELTADSFTQSGDPDTVVNFVVNVTAHSNNPDIISFGFGTDHGWSIYTDEVPPTLNDTESYLFNVSVTIPSDAEPLWEEALHVTAFSRGYNATSLQLNITVNAQRFAVELTADNATASGNVNDILTFGFHVRNAGNNLDAVNVTIPALPAGWLATVPVGSIALTLNETTTFDVTVHLPSSFTAGSVLDLVVTAASRYGDANASATVHARLLLPDFVVGVSGIVVNASSPTAGDLVSVQVNVVNLGAPITVTFAVTLADGHANLTALIEMTPAGTTIASFTWTALAGVTHLDAVVDSSGSVPEENEANNHGALTITGLARNVAPVAVAASATAAAHPGEAVTISAAASSDPDGSVAGYYFDFGDGTNSGWVTTPSVAHNYSAPGTFTVTIRVRDDDQAESAATTESVTVTAAAAANPSGGGGDMTLILLIALVAAAGVVGFIVMKKRAPKAPPPTPPAAPPATPPPTP